MKPSFRNRVLLEQHRRIAMNDPAILTEPVTNIVFDASKNLGNAWIAEATDKIGDWRSVARSTYMRWGLIINAAHVSESHYQALPEGRGLVINVTRENGEGPIQTPLKTWTGGQAAQAYRQIIPTIASYAVADLYGVLEEIVFDAWEILRRHKPEALIKGPENRELRRLFAHQDESKEAAEAWQQAWAERFDAWRRKKTYEPLHRVFVAFYNETGLKRPSYFTHTDVKDWAGIIETIAEMRHLFTHGEGRVNARLAQLSADNPGLGWTFTEGEDLIITLQHLQAVEYFINQLLTAINVSLWEKGSGRSMKRDLEMF